MKAICTLMLISSLLLAGCAKNAAIDAPASTPDASAATTTAAQKSANDSAQAATGDKATAGTDRMQKILFDFDSYLLTPASKDVLQKNARLLQEQPEVRIIVEGHTDERGSSNYNLALGEKRALAARTYLQTLGIAADRIKVVSYGEEKPASLGSDEGAWTQNRRAEFVTAN
jgi:peptidoglycan-associated lipoprotein